MLSKCDSLDSIRSYKNFQIYNEIGIHTLAILVPVNQYEFDWVYEILLRYATNRKKCENFKRNCYDLTKPLDYSKKHHEYAPVSLPYGVEVKLNYGNPVSAITVIINPNLFMESRYSGFNFDTYDHISITGRDINFWIAFHYELIEFFKEWKFTALIDPDRWILSRLDVCANIEVGNKFDIQLFEDYHEIVPKRNNYKIAFHKRKRVRDNFKEAKNKTQGLVMYDKTLEQSLEYHRIYKGKHVLRIENRLGRKKIKMLLNEIRQTLICDFPDDAIWQAYAITTMSPLVILNGINAVYYSGTFYPEDKAIKIIQKSHHRDSTKLELIKFLNSNSLYSEKSKNDRLYYRKMLSLFNDLGLSPVCINQYDSYYVKKIPSIKTVYLSAINNNPLEKEYYMALRECLVYTDQST